MISKNGTETSFSDIALNLGAILLAISSASFATFFVLSGPQAVVSNASIDSIQINRSVDESVITGSIGDVSKKTLTSSDAVTGPAYGTIYSNYAVRSLDNGIATIDFFEETSVRTIKAQVGNYVDGIGRIKNFIQKDGIWYVVASTN